MLWGSRPIASASAQSSGASMHGVPSALTPSGWSGQVPGSAQWVVGQEDGADGLNLAVARVNGAVGRRRCHELGKV